MATESEATYRLTEPGSMRIGLFIPCYIDMLFPEVGIATLELLELFSAKIRSSSLWTARPAGAQSETEGAQNPGAEPPGKRPLRASAGRAAAGMLGLHDPSDRTSPATHPHRMGAELQWRTPAHGPWVQASRSHLHSCLCHRVNSGTEFQSAYEW
jgi:hypothetical protein